MREWPAALVLGSVLAGLVVVAADRFRPGSALLAASLLLAAVLRAVLPERRAGLLAVRGRVVDVAVLAAIGAGLVVLTVVVPPPA
ncbi:DUF3017 domain-containing protein [Vallicoccus soli]|uniref:DUF3017 domain-containing protein n=1 Tax=Vallicoccus soli TaxID=2339232 RepID=A0A3A3YZJ4_9ACTN|nr:DUF3017 domain-containing protein [Vallicoccus soli]